ncbi:MAG: aminomethyl-transferring glycine dehydrogenase subunit GcvPA [Rhodospirillales bacterium]|nr:aminomethyl-transferring glycine dehydrogenase subunit GcvPA [Rhodospirillales bacterium]
MSRYLPLTGDDRRSMLAAIGVESVDALCRDVPDSVLLKEPVDLPFGRSEMAVEAAFVDFANRSLSPGCASSFLGAGSYRHHIPATVDHLIQRSEFLTSYTPYQPEISQGTLQYLFEFQTQVALLTGMEVANASMYDGATATAEAVMMAARVTRRRRMVLSGGLHPHYREVTATSGRYLGFDIQMMAPSGTDADDPAALLDKDTACVVVQNPDVFGRVRDLSPLADACHDAGALLIVVVTEPVSLGLLTPPGDMGADIVAGEGQPLGNAASFGGPTLGLFATRERFVRQMPGRIVGETIDANGRRGYVLTLSTREQHIRREKATSNICTNSGLCALAFSIHVTLLGERGLARLAAGNHAAAVRLADQLAAVPGVEVLTDTFFNELTVSLSRPAKEVVDALADRGILAGVPMSRFYPDDPGMAPLLLIAATELNTAEDMDRLAEGLGEALA